MRQGAIGVVVEVGSDEQDEVVLDAIEFGCSESGSASFISSFFLLFIDGE